MKNVSFSERFSNFNCFRLCMREEVGRGSVFLQGRICCNVRLEPPLWRQKFTLFATTNKNYYEGCCRVMNEFVLCWGKRRLLLIFRLLLNVFMLIFTPNSQKIILKLSLKTFFIQGIQIWSWRLWKRKYSSSNSKYLGQSRFVLHWEKFSDGSAYCALLVHCSILCIEMTLSRKFIRLVGGLSNQSNTKS